jgi:predicted NBD/HSP70 family sugar kinase
MPTKKTDYRDVKKNNRNLVYKYIYEKKSDVSKQEISFSLNLSIPTVTQYVDDLIAKGFVHETGKLKTGGRNALSVAPVYDAHYAVGLDITKNHVGIVIIDLGCNIIHFKRHRLLFDNNNLYFKQIGTIIRETVANLEIDKEKILGVGIGIPAIVDMDHEIVTYGPVIGFTNGRRVQFQQYIDYPCVIMNDANAAGFAENWHRKVNENIFYISLSNSVGGAFIIDGKIYNGNNQRGCEVGHITIRPDGPTCYCGQKGCLDAFCNAQLLSDLVNGKLKDFFAHVDSEVNSNSSHGNSFLKIWLNYLENLSIGINSLRMLYDCNIVLGGYVGAFLDTHHLETLRAKVAARNTFESAGTYLDTCVNKFEATAVGSALYYINKCITRI